MKKFLPLYFLLFFATAKSQTHIAGTLFLNIDEGTIEGKIKMSNFPHDKPLSLLLHKGMNIKFVKENGKVIYHNPKELIDGSNIRYDFQSLVNDNTTLAFLSNILVNFQYIKIMKRRQMTIWE